MQRDDQFIVLILSLAENNTFSVLKILQDAIKYETAKKNRNKEKKEEEKKIIEKNKNKIIIKQKHNNHEQPNMQRKTNKS